MPGHEGFEQSIDAQQFAPDMTEGIDDPKAKKVTGDVDAKVNALLGTKLD